MTFDAININPVSYTHLGVWQIFDQKECQKAVEDALSVGYRLIDTASLYRNEEAVGRAIKAVSYTHLDVYKRQFACSPRYPC